MIFNNMEDIINPNETENKITNKTNKAKQNFIIAFKIFVLILMITFVLGLILGSVWFAAYIIPIIWSASKILAILTTLGVLYLTILIIVVILNSGRNKNDI